VLHEWNAGKRKNQSGFGDKTREGRVANHDYEKIAGSTTLSTILTAVVNVLVAVVATVVVAVAGPHSRNAFAVATIEFVVIASHVFADAHSVFVH